MDLNNAFTEYLNFLILQFVRSFVLRGRLVGFRSSQQVQTERIASSNNVGTADSFRPFRGQKLSEFLDGFIDIGDISGSIREIVMGDIIDLMFLEEFWSHNPRRILNDLLLNKIL